MTKPNFKKWKNRAIAAENALKELDWVEIKIDKNPCFIYWFTHYFSTQKFKQEKLEVINASKKEKLKFYKNRAKYWKTRCLELLENKK